MPDKTRRAVLSLGGPLSPDALPYLLRDADADLRVGVDGGARHLLRQGILPHVVTGDFDSLTESERDYLHRRGTRIVPTPDQDYTDCDKALRHVLTHEGIGSLRLHAGTGGRLDHLYSVLSAVIKHARAQGEQADIRLVDEWGETYLCPRFHTLTGDDLPGRTISFIALGPVTGLTTTGVRWPLSGDTLAPGVRDGTLNEITAPTVAVTYESGDLLILLHHARRQGE